MKTYDELIHDLHVVEKRGFVKTHRVGNTGIGKTLENLLGIEENNFAGPNGYQTELKSARKGSHSMLTLFTKSPMPPRINSKLLQRFGSHPDHKGKKLHTTINAISKNTLHGREGFKIDVHDDIVEITHSDYGSMSTPYWRSVDLENAFKRKYPKNLLYVKANYRGLGKNEEFHYNEAWLMQEFDFDNFTNLLKTGNILVDIRIGQYPDGRPHDHGTGFRVSPDKLDLCFMRRKRVL